MTQLNPNKHALDTLSFALTAYFQSPEVCLSTKRKTLTLWAAAVARYSNLHLRAVRSSLMVTRGNWTDWFLEGIPPCYALTWNTRESALVSGPSPGLRYNGNCTLTKSSSSQYLDFKVCLRKNHTAKQFSPFAFSSIEAEVRGFLRARGIEQDSPVERIYQRLVGDWMN